MSGRLLRSVATLGSWTLVSRVAGFARDVLMAAYLGAGPVADAFNIAFKLPNMFRRLFAEGAFNLAFVPIYAKKLESGEDADAFAQNAFWGLASFLTLFVVIGTLAMPWLVWALASGFAGDARFDMAVDFGRITFCYIGFISLFAMLSGLLNAHGRFAESGFVPVLMNLVFIAAMLLARQMGWEMGQTLAWTVPITGVAQLGWTLYAARRLGFVPGLRVPRLNPDFRRLLVLAGPALLTGGVVQINLLVGSQVASGTVGAVSWLGYADRLYQLPLGVVGIAIGTVLLPVLSRHLRAGEDDLARDSFSRGAEMALFLTLPAAVALVVISTPLISVLYDRGAWRPEDTVATALALAAYGLGLPAFVLQKVLQPLYYAREDTRRPFHYALVSMGVNAAFAVGMMPVMGFVAAALATTVSGWVMVGQLWWGARKMGDAARPDARFWRRLWRIGLVSGVMGVQLWFTADWLAPQLAQPGGARWGALGLLCGSGIALYFALGAALGAYGLGELKGMLRRRRG
ncbi:murein biosynthesis integral membrane protein MurJ [Rhodobacter capsulatus]|uniref:Probable lipid II flippase MurJ n=1 Tax=Rhodobacter capsulatus TaxID=1061 RepID=A0A4U1K2Q8_RHOCA|nr:murein biosynthesis integral membrane protein MurJ [Rhodobacter capsulatus]TKD26342.1 murein biosynthesis integral membrane protein MurJ [Rhodobacter capsulatus]